MAPGGSPLSGFVGALSPAAAAQFRVRRSMSTSLKTWCLGALVAVNALLAHSLVYSWLFIYREFSYPIDFFMPINRTMTRATITLCVAAASVPLESILYAHTARESSSVCRIATILVTAVAATVSIAFAAWRYLR